MELTQEQKKQQESVYETVCVYVDDISKTIISANGIKEWFKAFIQSEKFSGLSREGKAEAFDNFDNIQSLLQMLQEERLPQS